MSETNSVKLMSVKNTAQIFGMSEWDDLPSNQK
jgi:hypothetical protein